MCFFKQNVVFDRFRRLWRLIDGLLSRGPPLPADLAPNRSPSGFA